MSSRLLDVEDNKRLILHLKSLGTLRAQLEAVHE